jgi:serpin B
VVYIKTAFFTLLALLSQCTITLAQPDIAKNTNAFAFDFYLQWRNETSKNIVLSPFSISAAVGMTYPGARNETADQMQNALRFHVDLEQHYKQFQALVSDIDADGSPMSVANTLWMQSGFQIEKDFLDASEKYFGSTVRQVNFSAAPDSARVAVNTLIEQQTRTKIKDLLPPGSVNPLTRLVLANAVYFKDSWATAFDPEKTKDREFFLSPKKSITAKFMELHRVDFPFYENNLVTVLELPYRNPRFSMLILLPKGDMGVFENSLTSEAYTSWNFTSGRFKSIQIPRFKIDHEVEPAEILKRFGMTQAFQEGQADFSGISKEQRLFISGIFHKAFIEVNEEGTEAAAATAVVVQAESEPARQPDFIANKPFMFILRDRISNCILFIGKVKDPTQ